VIAGILENVKRITVDLPDDLWKRLRLAAYVEDSSVSAIVRDRLLASSLPRLPEEGGKDE
jgi:hypothetical protein